MVSAACRSPVSYSTHADQQGDPARKDEDLAVLIQGQALALEGDDPAKPCPAFDQELVAGHERVLRAQPVSHDPQAVEGGLIQVRPLEAAHQLQGVHAGDGQDVSVGVALGRHREHRVRDRAERRRDDRLVELASGVTSPASHRLYCRSRLASLGSSFVGVCAHGPDRVGLAPAAGLPLVVHPPRPGGPVLGHQDALLPKGCAPPSSVTHDIGGDTHGDTGLSPGCPPLTPAMSLVVRVMRTPDSTRGQRLATNRRGESLMKLYVDTNGKQVTVTKDPMEKTDGQNGRQKTERGHGPSDVVDAGVRPGRRRRRGHHRHYGWRKAEREGGTVRGRVQAGGPAVGDQRAQRRGVPRGGDQGGRVWPRSRPADRDTCHGCHLECPFTSDA